MQLGARRKLLTFRTTLGDGAKGGVTKSVQVTLPHALLLSLSCRQLRGQIFRQRGVSVTSLMASTQTQDDSLDPCRTPWDIDMHRDTRTLLAYLHPRSTLAMTLED